MQYKILNIDIADINLKGATRSQNKSSYEIITIKGYHIPPFDAGDVLTKDELIKLINEAELISYNNIYVEKSYNDRFLLEGIKFSNLINNKNYLRSNIYKYVYSDRNQGYKINPMKEIINNIRTLKEDTFIEVTHVDYLSSTYITAKKSARDELKKSISRKLNINPNKINKDIKDKIILGDNYLPKALLQTIEVYDYNFNYREGLKKVLGDTSDISLISRGFANEFDVELVGIDVLVKNLGYTKEEIKDILQKVHSKRYYLYLDEFNDIKRNLLHWMYELAKWCRVKNLFAGISITDSSEAILEDILKYPHSFTTNMDIFKHNIIDEHIEDSYINLRTIKTSEDIHIYNIDTIPILYNYLSEKEIQLCIIPLTLDNYCEIVTRGKNHVVFGKELSPEGYDEVIIGRKAVTPEIIGEYFYATHKDNKVTLYQNIVNTLKDIKKSDTTTLSVYFLNMIKMTIEFLELLSESQGLYQSIFNYSFKKERNNKELEIGE